MYFCHQISGMTKNNKVNKQVAQSKITERDYVGPAFRQLSSKNNVAAIKKDVNKLVAYYKIQGEFLHEIQHCASNILTVSDRRIKRPLDSTINSISAFFKGISGTSFTTTFIYAFSGNYTLVKIWLVVFVVSFVGLYISTFFSNKENMYNSDISKNAIIIDTKINDLFSLLDSERDDEENEQI